MMLPLLLSLFASAQAYCQRSQPCWPTAAEIEALRNDLSPDSVRSVAWEGGNEPRLTSVPVLSPDQQPFYGRTTLQALYESEDGAQACHPILPLFNRATDVCIASIRNQPMRSSPDPAFVAFPLTAQHVQRLVRFANDHDLAVSVAGTGHDFIGRDDGAESGLFIRTTMMKEIEFVGDVVRLGPGLVFSEIQEAASAVGKYLSSGWASTVGIVGWSTGAGHGPFARGVGGGADNIVQLEMVLGNGELVTANASTHTELFRAMRGGGGSTFGVVTALTLRAHDNPAPGFFEGYMSWDGNFCNDGQKLEAVIDANTKWMASMDDSWSCLYWVTPASEGGGGCNATFSTFNACVYSGEDAGQAAEDWEALQRLVPPDYVSFTPYATWWERVGPQALEPIWPLLGEDASPESLGVVPSVLVSRETLASEGFVQFLQRKLSDCPALGVCRGYQYYSYATRESSERTALSDGHREAVVHLVFSAQATPALSVIEDATDHYNSLGRSSYFGESSTFHVGETHKDRYWGDYERLLAAKHAVDPEQRFWCRNCVGSEELKSRA